MRSLARTILVLAIIAILATLLFGPATHKRPKIAFHVPASIPGSLTNLTAPTNLTGKVLVQSMGAPLVVHQATAKNALASVTKIMTAYLVLTSGHYKLDETIPITQKEVHTAQEMLLSGDSVVIFPAGTKVTVHDLLYALLLPSGDNIADLLASAYPGGESAFVKAMNAKAKALGLTSFQFTEPSGVAPTDMGTAQDVVELTALAMKNPTFAQVVRTKSYRLPAVGTVHNLNALLTDLPGTVGVKTGWTTASGRNLVWATRLKGPASPLIIATILGATGGFGPVFREAEDLTSYAKAALGHRTIPAGTTVATATLGLGLQVPLKTRRSLTLWGPKGTPIAFRWSRVGPLPGVPGKAEVTVGPTTVQVPLTAPQLPLWYRIALAL